MSSFLQEKINIQATQPDEPSRTPATSTLWKASDTNSTNHPSPQAPSYSPIMEHQKLPAQSRNETGNADISMLFTDSQPSEATDATNRPSVGTSKSSSEQAMQLLPKAELFESSVIYLKSYEDWPMWFSQIRNRAFLLHIWEYINPFNETPKLSLGEKPGIMGMMPLKTTDANWKHLENAVHWFCHDQRSLDVIDRFIDETISTRYRTALFPVPCMHSPAVRRLNLMANENGQFESTVSPNGQRYPTTNQATNGVSTKLAGGKKTVTEEEARDIAKSIALNLSSVDLVRDASTSEHGERNHLSTHAGQTPSTGQSTKPKLKFRLIVNDTIATIGDDNKSRLKPAYKVRNVEIPRPKRVAWADQVDEQRKKRQRLEKTNNTDDVSTETLPEVPTMPTDLSHDEQKFLKEEEDAWERVAPMTPHMKLRRLWLITREEKNRKQSII
jgi:hypothetical protein